MVSPMILLAKVRPTAGTSTNFDAPET